MISLLRRLRAWLRALPLQRRVAYLTTAAVALAVAVTSVAGYLTLRILAIPGAGRGNGPNGNLAGGGAGRGGHPDAGRPD